MDKVEIRMRCVECAEKWLEHVNKMKGQLVTKSEDVMTVAKLFEKYVLGD